jgi:hypothetical protein
MGWAAVSDFLGRARVYFLLYLIQVAVFFSLPHLHTAVLFTTAIAVVGLCYGAASAPCRGSRLIYLVRNSWAEFMDGCYWHGELARFLRRF